MVAVCEAGADGHRVVGHRRSGLDLWPVGIGEGCVAGGRSIDAGECGFAVARRVASFKGNRSRCDVRWRVL